MPSKNDKAKAVYQFLIQAEKQNQIFTLEEIAYNWPQKVDHMLR